MFEKRKYRKQMKILGAELERAAYELEFADDAFDHVAYDEVMKKICKLNSKLYRSYGRFYQDVTWWIILILLLVLSYVVYLIVFAGDIDILR